ncbi:MAG: lytic transglycosylase domain-containing protein [Proteobacteria bacterium]|nr:lytic transglycosylase domain-containing protein [Pseudomonadota bacterium]
MFKWVSFIFLPSFAFSFCEQATTYYETLYGIPRYLLKAVSYIESGKKLPGKQGMIAWPWVINAHGKSYSFRNKEEAVAMVQTLQTKGIQSIDVGCMQINLKHHPYAFKTLEEAFDPHHNVAYAAKYLKKLKTEKGNWQEAIAHYHSSSFLKHHPYREKVLKLWTKIQQSNTHQNLQYTYFNDLNSSNKDNVISTHIQPQQGQQVPVFIRFSPFHPSALKRRPFPKAKGFFNVSTKQNKNIKAHYNIKPIQQLASAYPGHRLLPLG